MAGEIIRAFGAVKTLESNGGAVTANSVVAADDAGYVAATDGGGFPHARFVLLATFGSAPTEGRVLALYARPKNLDGAVHAQVPEKDRPSYFVGTFVVDNVTAQQAMVLTAYDVPLDADYYLCNLADQTVSAGWVLKVTPMSYKAA